MTQTFTGDGDADGRIIALQAFLAQVIARMPDARRILDSAKHLHEDFDDQAIANADNVDVYMRLNAISGGIQDTVAFMNEAVPELAAILAKK